MSHYIYKDKKFLEMPNGKILPLILIADSSVRDAYNRKHPAHWFINTLDCEPTLLVDKNLYQIAADEAVQSRIEWLDKYYPDQKHTIDDINPYGDTYRGNRKISGMKSFLSAKRTIPAGDFLRTNRFTVSLQPHDKEERKDRKTKYFYITNLDELQEMDSWYRAHREQYPNDVVYIGVRGIAGED